MAKKLTIEDMQRIAERKGGKCLSNEYKGYNTKLKWQCKEGHVWETRPFNIKMGRWCLKCYFQSKCLTIEEMQKIAKTKGGKCLSTKYIDNRTKLKWQCKKGHIWEAVPDLIKRGAWCPRCSIKTRADKRRQSIEELQEYARSKGGLCLSKEYPHSKTKLQWQCADGHKWWSYPSNIKQHWCPKCAQGLSERLCRKIFEKIFHEPFPSTKPSWLRGPKGGRLELDGYCKKLEIAFEYQGKHHYFEHDLFHRDYGFKHRRDIDKLKKKLCHEYNIKLIEVPYTVEYEEMINWIVQECMKQGIDIPTTDWIDYKKLDVYSPKKLNELKEIAKTRGGECLSSAYLGANTKMKWKCKEGHIWETIPKVIKRGGWCATCAGRHQWIIKDMRKLAEKKGGKCLSEDYVDNTTKLKWQCKQGHQWNSAPSNVLSGNWCPTCAGNVKQTIENMQEIAKERGGKCLSKEYINSHTKLQWQCERGHVWWSKGGNIKGGTWCPYCIGRHRTIRDMHIIAKQKGGECLSPKYLGSHIKLTWKCEKGHIWEIDPQHIISHKTWCPTCARINAGRKRRLTIQEMQEIAKKKGGKCLSKKYVDNRTKLKWQCKEGHMWEATPRDIKSHKWCPYCAKNVRSSIEEMQKLARVKRGKCLSKNYVSTHTKIKWQCKEGHIWMAQPSSIKSGTWCPICAREKRRK